MKDTLLIPSQPQSLVGVFNTGWKLGKHAYFKIIPFTLLLAIVSSLFSGLGESNSAEGRNLAPGMSEGIDGITIATAGALMILVFAIFFLLHAVIIYRINALAEGKDSDFAEIVLIAFNKILSLFGVNILYFLFVIIGYFLLILPGIYIMFALIFSSYLVVIKDTSVWNAIKESYQLVSGHWFRCAFYLIILILMLIAVSSVPLLVILKFMQIKATAQLFIMIKSYIIVVQTLALPMYYALFMAQIYDLQTRKREKENSTVTKVPV